MLGLLSVRARNYLIPNMNQIVVDRVPFSESHLNQRTMHSIEI